MDFDKVLALFHALNDERVEYVVFGAVALNAHGIVRGTVDLDLFVRPDESNISSLQRALRRLWDDPEINKITYADLAGDYPAIQYGPPGEVFTIDIVTRLGDAFRFQDIQSERVLIQDVPVPVATPRMLYLMKRDTIRPKDRIDAGNLKAKFRIED